MSLGDRKSFDPRTRAMTDHSLEILFFFIFLRDPLPRIGSRNVASMECLGSLGEMTCWEAIVGSVMMSWTGARGYRSR